MQRPAATVIAVAVAVVGVVVPAGGIATATTKMLRGYEFCPGPTSLIHRDTRWTHRPLASGVTLSEAHARDARGRVEITVLRVHLRNHNVRTVALHRALASGHRLTTLARNRHYVAAINAMYFNPSYGAPTVPFIAGRRPVVLGKLHRPAAGIGVNHRAESGAVWLHGSVRGTGVRHPLTATNVVYPPHGLTLYTPIWGSHRVPMPAGARERRLRHGRVVTGVHRSRRLRGGELLVARGSAAIAWLREYRFGMRVRIPRHVVTTARVPFAQAYGTGTQMVVRRGHTEHGLFCRRSEVYAARTAIGWQARGGLLMLVTVQSRRGPDFYGVDENQMSSVMVELGATQAFALDGGSSTELLARLPTRHRVRIRNHGHAARHHHRFHYRTRTTYDLHVLAHRRAERWIPVGIGIYARRPRH